MTTKDPYDVSQRWFVLPSWHLGSKNVKVKNAKVQNNYFICSFVWIWHFISYINTLTNITSATHSSALLTHAFSPQVTDEYQFALYPFGARIKSQCDLQ